MDEIKNKIVEVIDPETELSLLSPISLKSKSDIGKRDTCYKSRIFYISDLHLDFYINHKKDVKKQIYKLIDKMIEDSLRLYALISPEKAAQKREKEGKKLDRESGELFLQLPNCYFIFGGDISESFEYSKIFYHRIREIIPDSRMIAVLGNHEIAAFDTVENAVSTYKELFSSENICLLQNNCIIDFRGASVKEREELKDQGIFIWPRSSGEFIQPMFYGGIGFNKFDEVHNAETIRTCSELQGNCELEIAECERFIEGYKKALDFAKLNNRVLIVLSHYPLYSWLKKDEYDGQCYYFYGHDHKNVSYGENGAYIFGDNQIGYNAKEISFKCVSLGKLVNPFFGYKDGFRKISIDQYCQFYLFIGEGYIGYNKIGNYIEKGYSLMMIKKSGYYAFFLIKEFQIYICKGGTPVKLPTKNGTFTDCYLKFDKMVKKLIEFILPIRIYLEQISKEVKAMGGTGTIHGLIVDFDLFHHIMISPDGGSLTFYYSPQKGLVQNFRDISGFLNHIYKNGIDVENKLSHCNSDSLIIKNVAVLDDMYYVDEPQEISIKDSLYKYSEKLKNLERIFTGGVLREWNEDLLYDAIMVKQ